MLRYLLYLPEFLVFGPAQARFKFAERQPEPVDADRVWQTFTRAGRFRRWLENNYPPSFVRRFCIMFGYRYTYAFRNHAWGIARHYDLGNEFYSLFLDRKYMFYSFGDFESGRDSLEDAQENKANYLVRLIDPKPGERILELGCGWGGMLRTVYGVTGDKENLLAYNLSKEQNTYIERAYGFRVESRNAITTEYEANSFDKIYSIGVFEHVRERELFELARKLSRAIRPGGKIVLHFFCQLDELPHPVVLVLGLDIFPGSELAPLKVHLKAFDAANLRITHHSIHDYRPTIQAWFQRLAENRTRAIALVGVRNYNRYLCYLAVAWRLFDMRHLLPMRFVLEPRTDGNGEGMTA